jgi:hypothetical protein
MKIVYVCMYIVIRMWLVNDSGLEAGTKEIIATHLDGTVREPLSRMLWRDMGRKQ